MSASAYRHLRSRTKLRKYVRVVPVLGLLLAAGVFFLHDDDFAPRNAQPFTAPPLATPVITAKAPEGIAVADTPVRGARLVYPHSVVAGGVHSKSELATVIKQDRVVAAHYANINVDAARVVRVSEPRAVHVSYRIGDKVYWTAKKVMLAKGEALLTDGTNEMRTRCGNRISETPQMPVSKEEPSIELLDASMPSDSEGVFVASANSQAGGGNGGSNPVATLGSAARSGTGTGAGAPGWQTTNLSNMGGFFTTVGSTGGTGTGDNDAPQSTAPLPTIVEINSPGAPDAGTGTGNGGTSGDAGTTPTFLSPPQANETGPAPTIPDATGEPDDDATPNGDPKAPPKEVDKELVSLLAPGTLGETPDQGRQTDSGTVPEPASFWLIAAALAGLALLRRAVSARAAARLHSSQPPSNKAI